MPQRPDRELAGRSAPDPRVLRAVSLDSHGMVMSAWGLVPHFGAGSERRSRGERIGAPAAIGAAARNQRQDGGYALRAGGGLKGRMP